MQKYMHGFCHRLIGLRTLVIPRHFPALGLFLHLRHLRGAIYVAALASSFVVVS